MTLRDIIFHLENIRLRFMSPKEIFSGIYDKNSWGSNISVSGSGSDLKQTEEISKKIPVLFNEMDIKSVLDAPCGDFLWLSRVRLNIDKYIGIDIVRQIVKDNNLRYKNENRKFLEMDLMKDRLPKSDVILCRDCLVHFSNNDIKKTIKNFKKSGSRYLLTTTFPKHKKNVDIPTGRWRPINLEVSPFFLPHPHKIINEKCTEVNGDFDDKSLALWRLEDIKT